MTDATTLCAGRCYCRQLGLDECALAIPAFLLITPEREIERRAARALAPAAPMPAFARERTPTEIAYYDSIERDKAIKNELDRPRFEAMRKRAAQEKAEQAAIKQACLAAKGQ